MKIWSWVPWLEIWVFPRTPSEICLHLRSIAWVTQGHFGLTFHGFPGRETQQGAAPEAAASPQILAEAVQRCVNSCDPRVLWGHGAQIIKHFSNVCNSFHPSTLECIGDWLLTPHSVPGGNTWENPEPLSQQDNGVERNMVWNLI